jgi:hypothetical protein
MDEVGQGVMGWEKERVRRSDGSDFRLGQPAFRYSLLVRQR